MIQEVTLSSRILDTPVPDVLGGELRRLFEQPIPFEKLGSLGDLAKGGVNVALWIVAQGRRGDNGLDKMGSYPFEYRYVRQERFKDAGLGFALRERQRNEDHDSTE